jgi:hypothetical protein
MVGAAGRGRQVARLLLFVVPFLFASAEALRAETPEEIFSRGNAAYEQERFAEAAEAYRMLIKYQIRDPRVEYNLGNAEFRLGRLGRALVHFERARRLDPTDPDIRANLDYARSFCFDRVDAPEVPAGVHWIRAGQERLGPDRQAWTLLLLIWILAALMAWALSRPGRWNAAWAWVLAAGLLLNVAVGLSWYLTWERLEGKQNAVVLQPAVEVLAGPGANNATLFTVHEGLLVEVRDVRPEWIQVSLPNGLNGWLTRDAIELI